MDLKLIVQAAKCQLLKVQQRKMHFWWIIGSMFLVGGYLYKYHFLAHFYRDTYEVDT